MKIYTNYSALITLLFVFLAATVISLIDEKALRSIVFLISTLLFNVLIWTLPYGKSNERKIKQGEEITILHYEILQSKEPT